MSPRAKTPAIARIETFRMFAISLLTDAIGLARMRANACLCGGFLTGKG
jgi:hypothetical protein